MTDSALLDETAQYLVDKGVGVLGKTLFTVILPDKPYEAVAVIPTGGPVLSADPTDYMRIQVLCRDRNGRDGLLRIETVYKFLANRWNVLATIKGRFEPTGRPGPYFQDDNNHFIYSSNYVFTTTQ